MIRDTSASRVRHAVSAAADNLLRGSGAASLTRRCSCAMGACSSRKVEPVVPVAALQQDHTRRRRSSFQKISESASQIRRKLSFSQTPNILSADLLSLGDFASSYTMSDQVSATRACAARAALL